MLFLCPRDIFEVPLLETDSPLRDAADEEEVEEEAEEEKE